MWLPHKLFMLSIGNFPISFVSGTVEVEPHAFPANLSGAENCFEDPTGAKEDDIHDGENTADPFGPQDVEDSDEERKACSDNSDDEPLVSEISESSVRRNQSISRIG